ncbi:hypothetical protein AVEN_238676-1 [Araneus ventricosus]|uniref:Uncharacterized protein n=1 Tax=Araneus ventricosus TaxID=182803 RepID=A0A4Y2BXL2_ARAVE|nr:hypothetical protein AVEN_238676-1 [Araneus ventricosus]
MTVVRTTVGIEVEVLTAITGHGTTNPEGGTSRHRSGVNPFHTVLGVAIGFGTRVFYVRNSHPLKIRCLKEPAELHVEDQTCSLCCGVSLEKECRLRSFPRHLTTVQNYEVDPKIALALFQNGT